MTTKMNGAKILVESLKKEGVGAVFGYPGGQALPLFDALYHSDLKFYLVRRLRWPKHEADYRY